MWYEISTIHVVVILSLVHVSLNLNKFIDCVRGCFLVYKTFGTNLFYFFFGGGGGSLGWGAGGMGIACQECCCIQICLQYTHGGALFKTKMLNFRFLIKCEVYMWD